MLQTLWGKFAHRFTVQLVQMRQLACTVLYSTSPPQSNLGIARRSRTSMQQSTHWLQWDAPNSPPKLPFPLRRSPPSSNTPIPRPTPLTTPNGIWIHSAVLPQYTFRTHIQTDTQTERWDKRQVYANSAYALLIVSDALIKNPQRQALQFALCTHTHTWKEGRGVK